MLKKEFRVVKKKEFEEIKQGRLIRTPLFGFLFTKATESKIGFIISKKISKKAVDRNRIRRILAEAVRLNFTEWQDKKIKGLFLVKPAMLNKGLTEAETTWKETLRKLS